jgi:hypothetical protein
VYLRRAALALTVAGLVAGLTGSVEAAGPWRDGTERQAVRCPKRPAAVPITLLVQPVPVADCDLRRSRVRSGELAARVPDDDGEYVTVLAEARARHPASLTVWYANGAVGASVTSEAPLARPAGDDRTPPAPVQRLGPASDSDAPVGTTPYAARPKTRRCTDSAGSWLGMQWSQPYRWWFNVGSVPDYLAPAGPVSDLIQRAAHNLDTARNDCGLSGGLRLSQLLVGATNRATGVRGDGTCDAPDNRNVVSFGTLASGLLALTCVWWVRNGGDGRTVEADIRINSTPDLFAVQPSADCRERWDLEGTLTHEFGHVFGLGHVSYAQHSELTMSDGLPPCSTQFRGLGLGDYLTLREHYGGA